MIAKASCLHPSKDKGLAVRTHIFWQVKKTKLSLKQPTLSDIEYRRLKADFARIAHPRTQQNRSKSESSRSPSPVRRQPLQPSTTLPKFKIATFYSTDVELCSNQIEPQFDLHQITDDDERYSLTCAALSGEVASDVRDVLL